jgi:hypothetical protein
VVTAPSFCHGRPRKLIREDADYLLELGGGIGGAVSIAGVFSRVFNVGRGRLSSSSSVPKPEVEHKLSSSDSCQNVGAGSN